MSTYRDQLAVLLRNHNPREFTSKQIAEALNLTRAQVTEILATHVKAGRVLKHRSTGHNQLYCWNTQPGTDPLRRFMRATSACKQLVWSATAQRRAERGGPRAH